MGKDTYSPPPHHSLMAIQATLSRTAARYPLQVFFTVAALLALLVTALFYAGFVPITRSIRNFLRLLSLTLVLFAFAAVFWAGPVFERLLR